jgi:hypothetical protein
MSIVLHLTKTDNLNLLDANGNPVDLSIEQGANYNKVVIQDPKDLTTVDPNFNPLNAGTNNKSYAYTVNGSIRKNYADSEPNEPPLVNWYFETFVYDPTSDLTTIIPTLSATQSASLPHTNNRKSSKETPIPGNNIYVYDIWVSLTARIDRPTQWGAFFPEVVLDTIPPEGTIVDLAANLQQNYLGSNKAPTLLEIQSLWYFNFDEQGNLVTTQGGDPTPIIAGYLSGINSTDLEQNPLTFAQLVNNGISYIDYQDGTIRVLPGTVLESSPHNPSGTSIYFSYNAHLLFKNTKIASGYVEVSPRVTEPNRTIGWNG